MKRVMGNFGVVCFVLLFGGFRSAYSQVDETSFKQALLSILEAADENFDSIKGEIDVEHAGFFPKLQLPGAQRCSIKSTEDGLNAYHCVWLETDNLAAGNAEMQKLVQWVQRSVPSEWSAHIGQALRRGTPVKKFEFYQHEYHETVGIHSATFEGRFSSRMLIQIQISPSIVDFMAKKQGADPTTKKTTQKTI